LLLYLLEGLEREEALEPGQKQPHEVVECVVISGTELYGENFLKEKKHVIEELEMEGFRGRRTLPRVRQCGDTHSLNTHGGVTVAGTLSSCMNNNVRLSAPL